MTAVVGSCVDVRANILALLLFSLPVSTIGVVRLVNRTCCLSPSDGTEAVCAVLWAWRREAGSMAEFATRVRSARQCHMR